MLKSINKASPGLKNPEIVEFGGSGPSHNKTEISLHQNEAEYSPRAFKPIIKTYFPKIHTTNATQSPQLCLPIFAYFCIWRSTWGRPEGAPRSHSRAKRARRNTQDVKIDANNPNKKGDQYDTEGYAPKKHNATNISSDEGNITKTKYVFVCISCVISAGKYV